jgi:putative NADPH-quinone reductase
MRQRLNKRIAIIQGHPDAAGHHLLNAMADVYAEAAISAGHQVRRIEVAELNFPLLRTQLDFETGELPSSLVQFADTASGVTEAAPKLFATKGCADVRN